MRRTLAILILVLTAIGMQAQRQISYIKTTGAWYQVYDESGKKVTTVSKQTVGEVIGVSGNTFTSRDGNWIKIYDKTGKKISTKSAH